MYLRQSLDVQEGIDRQRARCAALIEARGWQLVGQFEDNDTSASKPRGKDTAWARLLTALDVGGVDVVVAVDLDRLLRSIKDLVEITERGTMVTTVDGDLDLATADGEFRATIAAGLARFETQRKSERQRRAQAYAALDGRRVGGRRPFGWAWENPCPGGAECGHLHTCAVPGVRPAAGEKGRLVPDQEAQAAIQEGYRLLLSGVPLAGVARRWNAAELRTGQGGTWRHDNVRAVLVNPRHAGLRAYNGEVVGGASWPALVPEETWRAAVGVLDDPIRRHAPRGGRRLLSGLGLCGVCGATVHAGGAVRTYGMYRCSGSFGHVNRMSDPVDDYVGRLVVGRLAMPDAATLLHDQDRPDVGALRDEATAVRSRLESVALEFADGDLTTAQLRVATERLRERLAEAEAKLADAGRVSVLGPLVNVDDVAAAWAALETDRRRAVIDALMIVTLHPPGRGTRTFRPESVGIAWKTTE